MALKNLLLSFFLLNLLFSHSCAFDIIESGNFPRKTPLKVYGKSILSFYSELSNAINAVVNISIKNKYGKKVGAGSGVILSTSGYIVTNYHVIKKQNNIYVTLANKRKSIKAKIIGYDKPNDLAILKIEKNGLTPITFANSDTIALTDLVFAIGNPMGIGTTISQGIISAKNRRSLGIYEYENLIQTDASINPGNSGGALVDNLGRLIGINSAILSKSGGNHGIGFAIPSNIVAIISKAIIEIGKFERGYFGASFGIKNEVEVFIEDIDKKSAAYKAGLRANDIIVEVNGQKIDEIGDMVYILGLTPPRKSIDITYKHNHKIYKKTIVLGHRPE